MRRRYVASTSLRHHVPTRFLINQCQIITVLILNSDIIENSRIELRGIVLPVQLGGLLGGQRVCWPPLSNYWGACPPPPPPRPSSYAYEILFSYISSAQMALIKLRLTTTKVYWYTLKCLSAIFTKGLIFSDFLGSSLEE